MGEREEEEGCGVIYHWGREGFRKTSRVGGGRKMGSGGEFGMSFSGGLCAVLNLGCTSFGMHCEMYEWISLKRLGESTVEWSGLR